MQSLDAAPGAAAPCTRPSHATTIFGLLASGRTVSTEAMAQAIYCDAPRPTTWEASLRSTIHELRRAQARLGMQIICEGRAYRLITGDATATLLPGCFAHARGFLPEQTARRAA